MILCTLKLFPLSESFTDGFTYHSDKTPVISETMLNPVTGTIVDTVDSHDDDNVPDHTTEAASMDTMIDVHIEGDNTTEPQRTSDVCPSHSVCV